MTTLRSCPYPIEQLLPQAAPMILIDEVVGWSESSLAATLTVRPDTMFFEKTKGIAAHVSVEWMAQTCAAFVGAQALEAGGPVRVGFLLGTRDFKASVSWFSDGDHLLVTVQVTFRDEEMAVFDCEVERSGDVVAKAQLTVYQPTDLKGMLSAQGISIQGLQSTP